MKLFKMKSIGFIFILFSCFITASCTSAAVTESSQNTVEIFKYDHSRQCEQNSGITLDEMEKELTSHGIAVLSSRKGSDGKIRMAVCGSSSGIINIYVIYKKDLEKAGRIHFQEISEINNNKQLK